MTAVPTWTSYESALLGNLTLTGCDGALARIYFEGTGPELAPAARQPEPFASAIAQLDAYFAGELTSFDIELELRGTPFQQAVWAELRAVPLGETITYGELARRIGRGEHVRAVGGAVGRTPVPVIVPCHRVIGADGSLTGYGGGLRRKAALLNHERRVAGAPGRPPAWADDQLALLV